MKKLIFPFAAALLFFCGCNNSTQTKSAFPELLARKDTVGKTGEWQSIQDMYGKYTGALIKNPDDDLSRLKLAEVYMNEARITGQQSHYYSAAIKELDHVIENKKAISDHIYLALAYKASVLLSLHQFTEAKRVADLAVKINTFDAGIYGALVDANVELGNYDEAVKNCDKMMSVRPDLRSYSRASYLRQLYGDNQGAIEAMKLAVTAGLPGLESTEWARVTLGDLYLNTGKLDSAWREYEEALYYRPNYPYAYIGLAKVARAKKDYGAAIDSTKAAIRILSEASFVSLLGDLYELKGDAAKSKEVNTDVIGLMEDAEKEQKKDDVAKHNANREIANAYLADKQFDKALTYANNDLAMRPENIDANELVAWILYMKGDYANAKMHAEKMMRIGTKNAASLYKAGLIMCAAGDKAGGQKLMEEAVKINPNIDPRLLAMDKAA